MKNFNVGIKGVITDEKGSVLVMKAPQGYWEMPGGRIDSNESIDDALNRELKEELTNIKNIKIGRILHAARLHKDVSPDTSLVLIYFEVFAQFAGEPEISDEHTKYKWLTIKEASKILEVHTRQAIQQLNRH